MLLELSKRDTILELLKLFSNLLELLTFLKVSNKESGNSSKLSVLSIQLELFVQILLKERTLVIYKDIHKYLGHRT